MNGIKLLFITGGFFLTQSLFAQKTYKAMMHDMKVNFYDVCKEADRYFETHDKGKGSGWKGYQRWKAWNEDKYYPSGDRSKTDPYFLSKAYKAFLQTTPAGKSPFPNGWRDLGPYDANTITSHYSPGIGRVECFWVNPGNMQHIYMGSRSGGFWRTSNGGLSWENTTDFLIASGVNTITVSPGHPDSVLINVRNANNGVTHGIYQSGDGGATWTQTNFNPANLGWGGLGDNERIYILRYHPVIPNLVFAGTSNGLFRSTDNFQTWTQLLNGSEITDIEFHPANPGIMYVYDDYYWGVNQNVVLRSTDFGQSFTPSASIAGNNDSRGIIAVSSDCYNCVYFASGNGVWKSTDAAQTFTFLSNPGQSCDGFAVSDLDTSYMVYGYVDIESSSDGGHSFNQITSWANSNPDSTYVYADLRTAECINGVFYVGTDGYLAASPDNGTSWYRLNDGTGIREFYAVGLSQSNWSVQMAGSQDNGTSILDETGWIEWNGGDGMEAIVQPLNDDWMIGSWQFGSRQRTKDGGQTRHGVNTPQEGYWQAPLFFDPNNQMKVYHCSDSLFVSEEFGDGWSYVGSPGFGDIRVGAIAENNSNNIILARGSDIVLSQDGGQSYASIANGLPGHAVADVAFDPNDDNTIVVVYSRYQNDYQKVYISHDLGASWSNITHNVGNMPIRTVVIDHTNASNIYLGTEIGVFYKPMNGTSWNLYNTNLANTTVRDLEIQYGSNVLRAATWGRGLWDYTLVGRNDFPSILTTHITDAPTDTTPRENADQYVTSVISYAGTLAGAYVKWSVNNPTFDSTIVMNNTVDSTWQTQAAIPNYPAGTKLYFKVYAVGSNADTTETYKFMYTVRPHDYCRSSGDMSYATAVTQVTFNTINNTSGKTQPYTNYRATDSTIVSTSESYNLDVHLNTDGNYQIFAKAWIDWNKDIDFADPGEEYDLGSAQNTVSGPTSLSPLTITVPANAAIGKTTMRVSCRYNTAPTHCQTNVDGEVEDYRLIIQPDNVGIEEVPERELRVYPNPGKGNFSVYLGKRYSEANVELTTITGQRIDTRKVMQKEVIELNINQPAGIYILKVLIDTNQEVFKLIKE